MPNLGTHCIMLAQLFWPFGTDAAAKRRLLLAVNKAPDHWCTNLHYEAAPM
jgi:hypothetical protein